jgi:hypothetical protein
MNRLLFYCHLYIHPSVSCEEMGIPREFCVCHPLDEIPLSEFNLHLAAVQAVNTINSDLLNGTRCSPLKLTQVTAGAVKEQLYNVV